MIRVVSIYMLTMLIVLSGCSDDSFRGTTDGMYGDGSQSIPVLVALGDPSGGIAKGSGAIGSMDQWAGKHIYVYAFNRDVETSYLSQSRANPLNCLVDGSRENVYTLAGKKARIVADDAYAEWVIPDSKLVYPVDKEHKRAYDFFAYYVDDAVVPEKEVERDDGSVRLSVEIDGSQDLMSSKAELTEAQLEPFTEKDRIFVMEKAFGFYTAQRNIAPTFLFRHHLVRLEFELVAGLVREEQKIVYVHSMGVESRYRASFTVADREASRMGLEFQEGRKELQLTEDGNDPMKECTVVTRPSADIVRENVKMGDCLLLAPDVEYDAYMLMTEIRSDGTTVIERVRTPLKISYGDVPFQAGNQYKVKLTIYGATKVSASVEMEPWRDGGSIEMDEEKDKPII